jgi:transcription initiation factor TFIID subunit 12
LCPLERKLYFYLRIYFPAVYLHINPHDQTNILIKCVLSIADEFVDQVITAACKCAKARGSKTLEIRDIQLILERNYNIRIPGYASDEIRTVRKFQPAQGWIAKMSAIQAAKVTGGKADL